MAAEIKIVDYEDWMRPQIAALFSLEYGVNAEAFSRLMVDFYEHPFQKKKCVRLAAVDGEKVVGFQSFFFWPYQMGTQEINSLQSGNSLVHPDYRGKGIFRHLLEYIDQKSLTSEVEVLVGFPVEASKNSFIRNGWKNILDLEWFVKVSSYISPFTGNENRKLSRIFSSTPTQILQDPTSTKYQLNTTSDFLSWRANYSKANQYFYYCYEENGNKVEFAMKTVRRKKIIRELTIGCVTTDHFDQTFIARGLQALLTKVRKSRCISIISFAQNVKAGLLKPETLHQLGFKRIESKIYFIVKAFKHNDKFEDPSNWLLFRADIDTW